MYSNNKKNVDRRLNTEGALDYLGLISPNLYLAQMKQNVAKKLIVKVILLRSDSVQTQQTVVRKLFGSSLNYLKPEFYDLRDGSLYLCTPVHHLSLQSILWIHSREKRTPGREFVKQFVIRMFEGLARLKPSDVFPQNLKPSNIFFQIKEGGDKSWVWSEAGLHTNNLNQYYVKMDLRIQPSKMITKVDPYQLEFYSLGIMILEMITMQPVQDIDKVVRNKDDWEKITNFREASEYYGKGLISIIHYLLETPKDTSLNRAIHDYKQLPQDEEDDLQYSAYYFTEEKLTDFLKSEIVTKMIKKSKDHITQKNINATEVFDVVEKRLDPNFNFWFNTMAQFEEFLKLLGINLEPYELLFVTTFYTIKSSIRYFSILQKIYSAKELIQNILVKVEKNYDSFKDFFEAMTNGRDFWKNQEIRQFLEGLGVPFEEKDVNQTLKSWCGSDKTLIKYDEMYKVFKVILNLSVPSVINPSINYAQNDGESPLKRLMEQLMNKEPDLVSFFRRHDLKENWIVDQKIQKILKSYIKSDDETLKRAFAEMWEKGNIPGDMSKQLNYIYLIRNLNLYENLTLLKMIITQKVIESGLKSII